MPSLLSFPADSRNLALSVRAIFRPGANFGSSTPVLVATSESEYFFTSAGDFCRRLMHTLSWVCHILEQLICLEEVWAQSRVAKQLTGAEFEIHLPHSGGKDQGSFACMVEISRRW